MEKDSIAEMGLTLLSLMGCPSCNGKRFKIDEVMNWTRLTCLQCEKTVVCPPGQAEEVNVQIRILGNDTVCQLQWHTAKIGSVVERLRDA